MLTPTELSDTDGPRIGGKAGGLLRLTNLGAHVPDWMVIDTAEFERHLDRCDPDGVIRDRLAAASSAASAESAASELQAAIMSTGLDDALAASIASAINDRGPVAVRSSAVGEDGGDRSYAGIFESYLHCTTPAQVAAGIQGCWASTFATRARGYQDNALGIRWTSMAVVIQDMVDGEVSGVMFTVDPVTGDTGRARISGCWGLGDGVVGGVCAPDEYTLDHDGLEVTVTIAEKDVEVVRAKDGGVCEREITGDRRSCRCLTPAQTATLVTEGVRIAAALGEPQDIEWTLLHGRITILQTRPVTAAAISTRGTAMGQWQTVWDNSNIQESFNGVTLPLTFSWAARVYEAIFSETLRMIGVNDATVSANQKVLRNMVGLVSGRVYYNINNWYRVLQFAPFFDRNKDDVERMIGVESPVDFIEGIHTGRLERIARIPRLAPVFVVLGWRMANRSRLVERFQSEVGDEVAYIRRDLDAAEDLDGLLKLSERGLHLFDRWAVQILNDLYLSNQAGRARRLLAATGDAASEETIAGLLASEEAVESLQPTLILMRLASHIAADPVLAGLAVLGTAEEAYAALRDASPNARRVLDDFISVYGDRCMGEQKLETISLREDPAFIIAILRNYLRDDAIDAQSLERDQERRRLEVERAVLAALPRRRRRRLTAILRRAREAVRDRERMRLTRTRIVGVGRSVYLRVGTLLHAAGQLDDPRHVFYLTMDEIQAFAEGRSVTGDLRSVVRVRIAEFAGYETTEPPNQFETLGPPYGTRLPTATVHETVGAHDDPRILQGTGCWPGVVDAQVRVVMSPHDDLDVRGKIMTTLRTDPGWGPLFPSVAGLLIERGSTLSHSAVLARELGIPAVVGVPGLMSRIRDGEHVRLDGGSGVVERLDDLD